MYCLIASWADNSISFSNSTTSRGNGAALGLAGFEGGGAAASDLAAVFVSLLADEATSFTGGASDSCFFGSLSFDSVGCTPGPFLAPKKPLTVSESEPTVSDTLPNVAFTLPYCSLKVFVRSWKGGSSNNATLMNDSEPGTFSPNVFRNSLSYL